MPCTGSAEAASALSRRRDRPPPTRDLANLMRIFSIKGDSVQVSEITTVG
jgi:hypothetical protein